MSKSILIPVKVLQGQIVNHFCKVCGLSENCFHPCPSRHKIIGANGELFVCRHKDAPGSRTRQHRMDYFNVAHRS